VEADILIAVAESYAWLLDLELNLELLISTVQLSNYWVGSHEETGIDFKCMRSEVRNHILGRKSVVEPVLTLHGLEEAIDDAV